jgi:Mrp family chromosome partitioning ATPase
MQTGTAANGMRLGDYLELLRRQWLIVLLCLALGIGLAVAYIQLAPREYRSTASVLVTATDPSGSTTAGRNTVINLDTEAQLVTSTETVAAAAKTLGVSTDDTRALADSVGVSVPPNTEILDITFTGDTAAEAQNGAQAFADAYLAQRDATAQATIEAAAKALQDRIDAVNTQVAAALREGAKLPENSPELQRNDDQVASLQNQLTDLGGQLNLVRSETVSAGRIVTQPRLPTSPSSPDPLIALGAGILLGLVGGVGLAARRHRRDDVIRTPEDLFQRTRVPVATVLSERLHDGDVAVLQPLTADGRGYARLRNLVTTGLEETSRRVVLVAGVRRGGGPVAANLAASLARSGEEVVLVCADVFGYTAAALLGDKPSDGLAEVLDQPNSVDGALTRFEGIPSLRILGPGRDIDRADALLQTRSSRKLVDRLLDSASYVVIEAPATTDSPDAQTLANVAELAVLVIESGPTTAREVLDACAQLESVGTPVLGGVIAKFGRDSDPDQRRSAAPVVVDEAPGEPDTAATADAPETPVAEADVQNAPEAAPVDDEGVVADQPAVETTVATEAEAATEATQDGATDDGTEDDGTGTPKPAADSPQGAGTVPLRAVPPGTPPGNGATRLPHANGTNGTNGTTTPPVTRTQIIPPGSRGPAPR